MVLMTGVQYPSLLSFVILPFASWATLGKLSKCYDRKYVPVENEQGISGI